MSYENKKAKKELDTEISMFLNEPSVAYLRNPVRKSVTYDQFLTDKIAIINAIRAGIPYSIFELIQTQTPFSENDWADILDISTKSLQRYKQTSRSFRPLQSEKIIELAEVTKIGLDVFDEMEPFKLWLNTPNFALGNLYPIELLKNSYGKEMVIGELIRIHHGIFI